VGRLLSHGLTGAEDRAGQRATQGRLRGADIDRSDDTTRVPDRNAGAS